MFFFKISDAILDSNEDKSYNTPVISHIWILYYFLSHTMLILSLSIKGGIICIHFNIKWTGLTEVLKSSWCVIQFLPFSKGTRKNRIRKRKVGKNIEQNEKIRGIWLYFKLYTQFIMNTSHWSLLPIPATIWKRIRMFL